MCLLSHLRGGSLYHAVSMAPQCIESWTILAHVLLWSVLLSCMLCSYRLLQVALLGWGSPSQRRERSEQELAGLAHFVCNE